MLTDCRSSPFFLSLADDQDRDRRVSNKFQENRPKIRQTFNLARVVTRKNNELFAGAITYNNQ